MKRLRSGSLGLALALAALAGCMAEIADEESLLDEEGLSGDAAELAQATYTFETHVTANKCLDVNGGASANGTKIQHWECNGSGAQRFRVEDLGGGLSRLRNVPTNKCIDVAYAATHDGAKVQLHGCNGSVAQSFRIMDEAGGVVFVNPNSNKCLDVEARGTANGTKVQLYTCNGTVAQRWTPKPITPPPPPPPPDTGLPAKVVAAYYPNWNDAIRLRDIPASYNVIYLFSARPEGESPGTTGAVLYSLPYDGRGAATNFNADLAHVRTVQKRKVILSIGGQGGGMSFPNREKSQRFVDSVVGIYNRLGGFDGIDWNTFEADQAPSTEEMIWISLELKRRYPGFLVTAPPAPWNRLDKDFCAAMVKAGALDYAAPQYYDGPGLALPSYIIGSVDEWVRLLGPTRVVVGFGIWNQTNYSSTSQVVEAWNEVERMHPTLRGGFNWSIILDEQQGFPFANTVAPLILQ